MSHIPCQCSSHTCQESMCQACFSMCQTEQDQHIFGNQHFKNVHILYNIQAQAPFKVSLRSVFAQAIRSGLVKPVKSQELWRSREANTSISLAVRSGDSFELKFSLRRRVEVVLATGVRPHCKCHLRTTCAGDRTFELATWALLFEQFLNMTERYWKNNYQQKHANDMCIIGISWNI